MLPEKWISAVLLLQLYCLGSGSCGKVLVWPCDMSHWLNLKVILEALTDKGHEVTVLASQESLIIDYSKPSTLNFEVIPIPQQGDFTNRLNGFLELATKVMPTLPRWRAAKKLQEFLLQVTGYMKFLCEGVVYNQSIMKKLRETKYDVMVIDPVMHCGELVAELLEVPFVYTLRSFMGGTVEKYCGKLPAPPSYVPVIMGGLTDRMTFLERIKNVMLSLFFDFWLEPYDIQFWDQFYSEALGKNVLFILK